MLAKWNEDRFEMQQAAIGTSPTLPCSSGEMCDLLILAVAKRMEEVESEERLSKFNPDLIRVKTNATIELAPVRIEGSSESYLGFCEVYCNTNFKAEATKVCCVGEPVYRLLKAQG